MLTYNNDAQFKADLLAKAREHRLADEYIKGTYGDVDGRRGCSIGCTARDCGLTKLGDHQELARQLFGSGDLTFITRVADTIFERLPPPLHLGWTERWLDVVPVGIESERLKRALPLFLLRVLDLLPETDRRDVIDAIAGVRDVLRNWADTGQPDRNAAAAAAADAADAAYAAAAYAAAAYAAAADAAYADAAAADAAAAAEKIAQALIDAIKEAVAWTQ